MPGKSKPPTAKREEELRQWEARNEKRSREAAQAESRVSNAELEVELREMALEKQQAAADAMDAQLSVREAAIVEAELPQLRAPLSLSLPQWRAAAMSATAAAAACDAAIAGAAQLAQAHAQGESEKKVLHRRAEELDRLRSELTRKERVRAEVRLQRWLLRRRPVRHDLAHRAQRKE